MRNYYIFKSGNLMRKENTIFLESNDEKKYIPVDDIDKLFLFGEITLNNKLINFLSQKGIIINFFNYYGYYSGSFFPREKTISGNIVINQAEHYLDFDKRMYIAKEFIKGADTGIIRNLSHHNKSDLIKERIDKIKNLMNKIDECKSIEELMGIEGNIRQHYYTCFTEIINQEVEFKKRVKRPPNNEINTMISFMNSLVYTEVLSQIYRTQLNPTISYLHKPFERRFSLSLDLAEIFKPFLGDRIIFKMFNLNMIKKDDFEKESKGLLLKEDVRKRIIKEFNDRLNKTIRHRNLKRNVSYKSLIRLECYKLIKHIINDKKYKVFKVWW